MEFLISIIKPIAYYHNAIVRLIPNFITDRLPPGLMGKVYLRRAKSNSFGIKANLTNQAICAKFCGKCPSNPFTQGGLYCISGKSKREVKMLGCLCFDCPIYDVCGGTGYYCKHGSADSMALNNKHNSDHSHNLSNNSIKKQNLDLDSNSNSSEITGLFSSEAYERRFIHMLINKENAQISAQLRKSSRSDSKTETSIYYSEDDKKVIALQGSSILETSLKNDIPHTHACGGQAKCSTCRILVLSGKENLSMRNHKEAMLAEKKLFPADVRLACQAIPTGGDITIRRLVKNEADIEKAIAEGKKTPPNFSIDKHVAILFSDIRSFTSFSEKNLPYDIVYILNDYFERVSNAIDRNFGYVDKYIGDGIMAIFGMENEDMLSPEEAAVRAALDMLKEVKEFNLALKKKYGNSFNIGIGIESGEVVLAQIGFSKKRQFTAIGDVVNTSSRIESANKEKGTNLLISQNVYKVVKDSVFVGENFCIKVKGKEKPLLLYEVIKMK